MAAESSQGKSENRKRREDIKDLHALSALGSRPKSRLGFTTKAQSTRSEDFFSLCTLCLCGEFLLRGGLHLLAQGFQFFFQFLPDRLFAF